jgi:DNA-binding transcriptional regulator YdaS (Cro superfamily)
MTSSKQTAALTVAGAVALASAAYALGSQASNGSAVAAGKTQGAQPTAPCRPGFMRGHRPDLSALATRLGVSTTALRQALDDLRPADRPGPREVLPKQLADALGIDVAKVTAALEKLRPRHERHERRDIAAALASELGLSTAKVRQAFEAQRDRHGGPEALAKALGVSTAKVRQAMQKLMWHDNPAAPLAKELGVSPARLRAAFDKLHANREQEFRQRFDAFAQKLADKLGLDVAKVRAALRDFAPGERHP